MTQIHGKICYCLTLVMLSSTVRLAFGTEKWTSVNNITIGVDGNVTLSFLNERDVKRHTITISLTSIGSYFTFTTAVYFGVPVTVNLTFNRAIMWRQIPTNQSNGLGWVVERTGSRPKFIWNTNEDNYMWINESSVNCPYLTTELGDKLIKYEVNDTISRDADRIVFYLRTNPPNEWCDIQIELSAVPLVANYCQIKGQHYCYKSLHCLNTSDWCDGKNDCDQGEDEVNCVKIRPFLFFLISGFISAMIIFVTAFLVIYFYFKGCRNALLRFRSTAMNKHLYDYPKFSEEAYNLHTDCSPVSDSISERKLNIPKAVTETYDSAGIYSRVITVSSAI